MVYRILLAALMLGAAAPSPSFAQEDQVVDASPPCGFVCKLWRNVSGNAQVSFGQPIDNAPPVDAGPLPGTTEGSGPPDPSTLVAKRGVVAVETASERAANRRQKQALEREFAKRPDPAALVR